MLGKTVSHYEVLYRLGKGGVGEVYAARDTLLGRMVAIKVLQLADLADAESRLRFLQEARAASALNHPNIVTIHDVIRDGDTDCIVMELVAGEILEERISRGAIALDETLDILARIADALAVAHQHGIVHRDLKPANVMLTASGGLKILDFGLAKVAPDPASDHHTSPRTQSGMAIGTPCYMSPEQALGNPLDGRSDIFSLGTIAVEMLTGVNPFEADSAVRTMHQVVYSDLSRETLARVIEPARGLVMKMLAKDAWERFANASELRAAIATVREGGRIAAPKVPSKRRIAVAAAATAVAIAAGIGSQLWRTRAVASVTPAAQAQMFTSSGTAQDHVRRGNELLATYWRKGYVDRAIEEFQRAVAIDARHAAAHAGLAAAYWRKYDADDDRASLELSAKNARHAVGLNPQFAPGHVVFAVAELSRGNTSAAQKEIDQALSIDPLNAPAHRWSGELAWRAKDDRKAEAEFRKAIELEPRDAELRNALGAFLYALARNDEAAAVFRQSIAIAADNAGTYRNLGAVLYIRSAYPGAARAFQQSLEIEPDATVYSNLGTLYFFQGLYPQSVNAYEKAVQLRADNHDIWENLGDAYRWTPGDEAKAREAYARSLLLLADEIRRHPDDATLRARQALLLAKQGDLQNAVRAADVLSRTEENPHNLYRLALAFELSGARQKSLTALERAIRNGYSAPFPGAFHESVEIDPYWIVKP